MSAEEIRLLAMLAEQTSPTHIYYFYERVAFYETGLENADILQLLKSLIESGYAVETVDARHNSFYEITDAGRIALKEQTNA